MAFEPGINGFVAPQRILLIEQKWDNMPVFSPKPESRWRMTVTKGILLWFPSSEDFICESVT